MRFPPPVRDPAEHRRAARMGRRDDLVMWHGRMAAAISRRFHGDPDELLGVAVEALCRAARLWDPDRPESIVGFGPYASKFIWNDLLKVAAKERRRRGRFLSLDAPMGDGGLTLADVLPSLPDLPPRERVVEIGARRRRRAMHRRLGHAPLIARVLERLGNRPATVRDLARDLGASLGGCKRSVHQLVLDGLVVRDRLEDESASGRAWLRYRTA